MHRIFHLIRKENQKCDSMRPTYIFIHYTMAVYKSRRHMLCSLKQKLIIDAFKKKAFLRNLTQYTDNFSNLTQYTE